MKSLGDFDQCLAVYHKCDNDEDKSGVDLVYIVSDSGVCCQSSASKAALR